jgi:6-phosphogluconolactonase (cycloisomerase 2 family)
MSQQTFLVGTGGKHIYACRLTSNGQLQLLNEIKSGKGPSWLVARDNFLYAANEHDNKLETFSIDDRIEGKLTSKSSVSSKGHTPCSLDVDPTGKWLAIAK